MSRNISAGRVTRLQSGQLRDLCMIADRAKRSFSSPQHPDEPCDPDTYHMGAKGFSPGVKQLGCEADYPPPSPYIFICGAYLSKITALAY
jgi:hypothetical protein